VSLKIFFQVQENTEVFTLSFLRVRDLNKTILKQNGIPFLSHAVSSDGEIMSYDLVSIHTLICLDNPYRINPLVQTYNFFSYIMVRNSLCFRGHSLSPNDTWGGSKIGQKSVTYYLNGSLFLLCWRINKNPLNS